MSPLPKGVVRRTSIRFRFTSLMIVMAVVPAATVTVIAAGIAARATETEIVRTNVSQLKWARQYLEDAVERISSLFYALQTDGNFMAVLSTNPDEVFGAEPRGELDFRILAYGFETLSRSLYANPYLVDAIQLYDHGDQKVIAFDYAGGGQSFDAGREVAVWGRLASNRASMFFMETENGVRAFRSIRRFQDRALVGGLSARIDAAVWRAIGRILDTNSGEFFAIFDDEGTYLTGNASTMNNPIPHPPEDAVETRRDNDTFYFAISAFEGRLSILKSIPSSALTASSFDTMRAGLTIGISFALVALALAIYASLRVTRPIVALALTMETEAIPIFTPLARRPKDEISFLEDRYAAMLTRIRELIAIEYQQEIELGRARLEALQARINPHFLHNTLNLMGGMALAANVPELHRVARAVSESLRYAMEEGGRSVPFSRELGNARNYLYIQEQRFLGRFTTEISIDPADVNFELPRLTLQPILENSFEHGFRGKEGPWRIRITLRRERARRLIVIRDNGNGINPERISVLRLRLKASLAPKIAVEHVAYSAEEPSMGLANVNDRLRLHYGPDCGVRIYSRHDEGTTVLLYVRASETDE